MNRAMTLNIFTGCLSTVWFIVCTAQPLFYVFIQNALGVSPATLGLLVGLLQGSSVLQLAAIFIYGRAKRKKPVFITLHIIHRVLTLSIAAAAFVAAATGDTTFGMRLILVAMPLSFVFMNMSNAGWWAWVAELFPEKIRGAFFMRRSALMNVVNVIWFFLASMLLDFAAGPARFWVYGGIFLFGALSGIADIVFHILMPELPPGEDEVFSPKDALEPVKNRNFVQFAVAVGLVQFSINLIGPFQSPWIVNPDGIGAPNTWLGIMYVISQLTWVLVAPFWGTIMDKWGRKPVVVLGCFYTLAWTGYFFLTPHSYTFILPLISFGAGLLSPAFWEGINQMMLTLAPRKNRLPWVAWYLAIIGLVSAGGSVVGGALFEFFADFSLSIGRLHFESFHLVQLIAIVMVGLSALAIARVREGSERPLGFVTAKLANPGILRTYANLDYLAASTKPGRAAQALRAMEAETGDLAIDEIVARLNDPYPEIREEAARALGRIGSPLALDPLMDALGDSSSSLRISAARALGKLRLVEAVPALDAVLDPECSFELADACLQALADIGGNEAERIILRVWSEATTERLRISAAEAASRLDLHEPVFTLFPHFLSCKSSGRRRQYALVFGNLLGENGAFYPYVSGSAAGQIKRSHRLFTRMEKNLRFVATSLGEPGLTRGSKQALKEASGRILEIQGLLDDEEYGPALQALFNYAQELLAAIFGQGAGDESFLHMALRIDTRLGSLVWILSEIRKASGRLFTLPSSGRQGDQDAARLLTLLVAFFLADF